MKLLLRVITPSLLIVAILGMSCAVDRRAVPEGMAHTWSASNSAMSWLVQQQRTDGHWGTEQHRVALTSLATLALLSHGKTPASSDYGKSIQNAMRALLRDAESEAKLTPTEEDLLTWCLSESFVITKIPMLLDSARRHASALDESTATHWRAFTAKSLCLSGTAPNIGKREIDNLNTYYSSRTNNMLDEASHIFVIMGTRSGKQLKPYLDSLQRQDIANWRNADMPLQTACVLSMTLLHVGGKDWMEWSSQFDQDLITRQITKKTLGWWTAKSLGVPDTPEIKGLSKKEADIYTTSLMLLSLQRPHFYPSFRPPHKSKEQDIGDNDIDIIFYK